MKKLLQQKLTAIQSEMKSMETIHLYHLKASWQVLRQKELLIIEIMDEYESQLRQPLLDDIELNYKMGYLTPGEREQQLNAIQVKDNY